MSDDSTPIDTAAKEPVPPPRHELQILLVQSDPDLKDTDVGHRAILVKSTARSVPALELLFVSDKVDAAQAAAALSRLNNVVCRTGLVGWNV